MYKDGKNVRASILSGLFWTFGERFFAQGVSFIVSLALARMLNPTDYGVVAIVMVFISISDVFISYGLGTSLIQKKDADELDFSSIFYAAIMLAAFFYIAIYLVAPWVEKFYEMPGLTIFIRVLSHKFHLKI